MPGLVQRRLGIIQSLLRILEALRWELLIVAQRLQGLELIPQSLKGLTLQLSHEAFFPNPCLRKRLSEHTLFWPFFFFQKYGREALFWDTFFREGVSENPPYEEASIGWFIYPTTKRAWL